MEFILIAWFSLADFDKNTSASRTYGYGYGFATSIVQEFNSEQACESAGHALQQAEVSTYDHNADRRRSDRLKGPQWNFVCVAKGKSAETP